mmetsp:Transcript_32422/g.74268  ORF Transcript_32422/g.74268 Transcript_32422/m.74268 type:complete len:140 (+) Transcript_32422:234-653(+)
MREREQSSDVVREWGECLRATRSSWRERDEALQTAGEPADAHQHLARYERQGKLSITGFCLCSMDSFVSSILPHICCPLCKSLGTLAANAEDERSNGLAGTVVICCLCCGDPAIIWQHGAVTQVVWRYQRCQWGLPSVL